MGFYMQMPCLLTDLGESRCRGAPRDAFNNHEFRENQCSESCGLFKGLHEILPYFLDLSSDLDTILHRRCSLKRTELPGVS